MAVQKSDEVADSADVIVIGAGQAGWCAALEAAAAGASVLLLEKQQRDGGSSIISGGSFAFAETDQQTRAGIADSEARFYDDLRATGGKRNDPRLLRRFMAEQRAACRWLESLGNTFGDPHSGAGQSLPRTHRAEPRALFASFHRHAAARPSLRLHLSTPALRLLRSASGRVEGVLARHGTREIHIAARRGVIIATGGFMHSRQLMRTFAPGQEQAIPMGGFGCTGDGLRMAWALGADLCDMGYIKGTFGGHPSERGEDHFLMHGVYQGAIAVNRLGERFVNEELSYKLIGEACLQQPGAIGFQILDSGIMAHSIPDGSSFDFRSELEAGRLIEAATLAELAEALEIDADTLQRTVEAYSADAATGIDRAFGRRSLCAGYGALRPIRTPPFYGYPSKSVIAGTYCGLVIDPDCRVIDVFGAPIEGLFAAGQVTGGFHGVSYMTGTALSKATVFGRIAARSALA